MRSYKSFAWVVGVILCFTPLKASPELPPIHAPASKVSVELQQLTIPARPHTSRTEILSSATSTLPLLGGSVALSYRMWPWLRGALWASKRWWLQGTALTLALTYTLRRHFHTPQNTLKWPATSPLETPAPLLSSASKPNPHTPSSSKDSEFYDIAELSQPSKPPILPPPPPLLRLMEALQEEENSQPTPISKLLPSPPKEKILSLLVENSELLKDVLQQHILYDQDGFYAKLSKATLQSLLHIMDPDKIFFTQKEISKLQDLWGPHWLEDLVEEGEYGLFFQLLDLKAYAAHKYLTTLHHLAPSDFLHSELSDTLTLPGGVEDFPKDSSEQLRRWLLKDKFLRLLLKLSLPEKSDSKRLNYLQSIYEGRFQGFEVKDVEAFLHQQLKRLRESLFYVLSRYSQLTELAHIRQPFFIEVEDSSLYLHSWQGLIRVMNTTGPLQKRGKIRPGDFIVGTTQKIQKSKRDDVNTLWEPWLFLHDFSNHAPLHPLTISLSFFRSRYHAHTQDNPLNFMILRGDEQNAQYELVEVPVLHSPRKGHVSVGLFNGGIPEESWKHPHHRGLFSAKTYSSAHSKIAVLKIPDFSSHGLSQFIEDINNDELLQKPWNRWLYFFYLRYRWNHLKEKLQIMSFYHTIHDLVDDHTQALIIDLRDNTGGQSKLPYLFMHALKSLHEQDLSPYSEQPYEFPHPGPEAEHTFTSQLEDPTQELQSLIKLRQSLSSLAHRIAHLPTILLVNSATASAAEYFTAELRAHKRVLVVGSPTTGKGTVLHTMILPKARKLSLTAAKFFVSDGTSPDNRGVSLDFYIPGHPWENHVPRGSYIPQPAFLDQELALNSDPSPKKQDHAHSLLRDPQVLNKLRLAFKSHLHQDYFLNLAKWKEQQSRMRINSVISLNAAHYTFYPFTSNTQAQTSAGETSPYESLPPTPPEDASWLISGDVALDQALWIAQKYAELLDSQESPP